MKPIPATAPRLVLGMLLAMWSTAASAQSFSLSVDSQATLYAAGQAAMPLVGGGTLPPAVVLTPGTGRVLSFASVSGSVSYNDVDAPPAYLGQYNGPDGGAVNFEDANWPNNYLTTSGTPGLLPPSAANAPTTFYMDMASAGGVSGLLLYESDPSARRVMFLSGLFTSGSVPQSPAPASLNFSSSYGSNPLTTSFAQLSPLLNQSFYIGDGLTGTGSGARSRSSYPTGLRTSTSVSLTAATSSALRTTTTTTRAASRCRARWLSPSPQPGSLWSRGLSQLDATAGGGPVGTARRRARFRRGRLPRRPCPSSVVPGRHAAGGGAARDFRRVQRPWAERRADGSSDRPHTPCGMPTPASRPPGAQRSRPLALPVLTPEKPESFCWPSYPFCRPSAMRGRFLRI